ncbi:hypothetical protein Tco_0654072 [Tanacetum coccineum]|uniref:Uncharacterized protein n=1 Tax=Tanacetum coccineum TaxID=301880 RepID=A0ABQ4X2N4_9ASTR
MSKKQDCTAMSSAEAEYVALSASCAQVMWMRTQLKDYGFNYNKISLYCDSQSAIEISCNQVHHSRTKHINVRYHFIKEHVKHVLRYDLEKNEKWEKCRLRHELTLEQSQQGVSNDVLVSIEGLNNEKEIDDDLPFWGIPLMEAYEPEAPLSQVHAPVYSEYLAPSDDDMAPAEDQPLLFHMVTLLTLSPLRIPLTTPLMRRRRRRSPSKGEEEEEPLVPTDSASPVPDYVPLFEETKPFKTDATLPPPVSPHTIVPLSQTSLRRAQKTVLPQTPLSPAIDALIEEWRTAPTSPSPSPSPLSSPLPRIPSPVLLLPSPTRRDIIPKADMPLQKKARFTAPSQRFEIGESLAAAAARQPVSTLARGTELDFITALEEVKESVTDIAAKHRHDIEEFYTRHQDT